MCGHAPSGAERTHPRLIRTVEGSAIGMHGPQFVRLISVLPGTTLGTAHLHTNALRRDLGRAVGRLGRALTNFDHPAFHRDFHWDLANAERVIGTYLPLVADTELADRIAAFAAYHRAHVSRFSRTSGAASSMATPTTTTSSSTRHASPSRGSSTLATWCTATSSTTSRSRWHTSPSAPPIRWPRPQRSSPVTTRRAR